MFDLLTYLWKDLNKFDVEAMPGKRVVVKDKEPANAPDDVHAGRAWETTYTETGLEAERVTSTSDGQRDRMLDGWDTAWLRESFLRSGGTGAYDEVIARVIKSEWATRNDAGDYPSNLDIVKNHTTREGAVQDGYSERNIKKYTWAYNRALEARKAEKTKE